MYTHFYIVYANFISSLCVLASIEVFVGAWLATHIKDGPPSEEDANVPYDYFVNHGYRNICTIVRDIVDDEFEDMSATAPIPRELFDDLIQKWYAKFDIIHMTFL